MQSVIDSDWLPTCFVILVLLLRMILAAALIISSFPQMFYHQHAQLPNLTAHRKEHQCSIAARVRHVHVVRSRRQWKGPSLW